MEKSVTFTGACVNEIIPSINRSFVYKAKEGCHVRIINNQQAMIQKNVLLKYYQLAFNINQSINHQQHYIAGPSMYVFSFGTEIPIKTKSMHKIALYTILTSL